MIYEDESVQSDADSITSLRILDTLYAILLKLDEPAGMRLIEKHDTGGLIGPPIGFDPDNNL